MEFRVLGELEVLSDAGELQALPPQIRAIICVLVLLSDHARPVRGDELTRLLAEEGDPQLLRSAISKARRILTPDLAVLEQRRPTGMKAWRAWINTAVRDRDL